MSDFSDRKRRRQDLYAKMEASISRMDEGTEKVTKTLTDLFSETTSNLAEHRRDMINLHQSVSQHENRRVLDKARLEMRDRLHIALSDLSEEVLMPKDQLDKVLYKTIRYGLTHQGKELTEMQSTVLAELFPGFRGLTAQQLEAWFQSRDNDFGDGSAPKNYYKQGPSVLANTAESLRRGVVGLPAEALANIEDAWQQYKATVTAELAANLATQPTEHEVHSYTMGPIIQEKWNSDYAFGRLG